MDRLELEAGDKVLVMRFNVATDLGKDIRQTYNLGIVPTFIVFDKNGKEVLRQTGTVPKLRKILSLSN